MNPPLRGLYAVTPDIPDTGALLALVGAFAEGGGRWLQYRNKTAGRPLRNAQAAQVAEFCKLRGIRLIVNDDVDLAIAVGACGVHLGNDDGDLAKVRRRVGDRLLLGASCYNEPARVVEATRAGADYVALGAVFPSPTKPGAVHATLDLLAAVKASCAVPVVAIGGIRLDNAGAVIAAGADMVAVISDLFDAPDVVGRTAAYGALFA